MNYLNSIISLIYRDLTSGIDRHVLIWDIVFHPSVFIFIGGYSILALFGGQNVAIDDTSIPYPAYLASGWIAISVSYISTLMGAVIWNDRRNGMFDQIMGMPFTRSQYILSNLSTIVLMAFCSAAITVVIGIPTFIGYAHISLLGVLYILFAIVTCSIIFGSIIIMAATRLKNRIGFTMLINMLSVYSQASSAFYPTLNVPPQIQLFYYLNPVTYAVNIIRTSLFDSNPIFDPIAILVLATVSVAILILGILSMRGLNI